MDTETIAMKEGDVFRWTYREPSENDGAWGRYHCCSRIAIFHNGRLRDTFWQIGGSFSQDCRSFGVDSLHKIDLTLLGNLSELDKASEYQADYFDDADIVDLNHPNSSRGNFFLRKGSKRSAAKMIEVARYKLEQVKSDQRSAIRKEDELQRAISRIEAGELYDVYL